MLMHANRDALDSATRFKFRLFLSQAPGLHICNSKVFRCLGPFAPAFFDQRAINRVGRREEVCCDAIRRQRRRRKDGWRGLTASSDWKNFWVDGISQPPQNRESLNHNGRSARNPDSCAGSPLLRRRSCANLNPRL
jgi:hypothetical protein